MSEYAAESMGQTRDECAVLISLAGQVIRWDPYSQPLVVQHPTLIKGNYSACIKGSLMPTLSTEYSRESRHFVLHKLHCYATITCSTIALGDRIVQ
jgi:hypothetical protein